MNRLLLQLPLPAAGQVNSELLVTLDRPSGPGFGGDPVLFLKPFGTKDRNEPFMISSDLESYADLRSFIFQQNHHFFLSRLHGSAASFQSRYYLAVLNNNMSKVVQPAQVRCSWLVATHVHDENRRANSCCICCKTCMLTCWVAACLHKQCAAEMLNSMELHPNTPCCIMQCESPL